MCVIYYNPYNSEFNHLTISLTLLSCMCGFKLSLMREFKLLLNECDPIHWTLIFNFLKRKLEWRPDLNSVPAVLIL